ncbi:antimicrobial peptide NK-lysin-like isoform X2 [Panthera onca]
MTSWVLLLLASVLLATPGLTFCGLTPEDHDLDMADRCQDEPFFRMLAQETPQRDLLNKTEGLIYNFWPSCKIMSLLKKMVGEEASQPLLPWPPGTSSSLPACQGAEMSRA